MYRKSTLYFIALFLVLEGTVLVAVPSRMPRPWRMVTGAINVVAAAGLVVLATQRKD